MAEQGLEGSQPVALSKHPSGIVPTLHGDIDSGIENYDGGDSNVNGVKKIAILQLRVIAEGGIASIDPKAKPHHVFLGGPYWKVWIDRVFMEKVNLIRLNEEIFFSRRCNRKHSRLVIEVYSFM